MNDVPLVKANNIHDINTSIIAIKKQLKQLNEAVGLIDMPTIDTSIFVKKSEVVDVVEADNMNPVTSNAVAEVADSLEPVDEVTSGNMQSVTSNGVYNKVFSKYNTLLSIDSGATSWTATEDVFCQYIYVGGAVASITVNNNVVSVSDGANGVYTSQFSGLIRKGQIVSSLFQLDLSRTGVIKFFRLY